MRKNFRTSLRLPKVYPKRNFNKESTEHFSTMSHRVTRLTHFFFFFFLRFLSFTGRVIKSEKMIKRKKDDRDEEVKD